MVFFRAAALQECSSVFWTKVFEELFREMFGKVFLVRPKGAYSLKSFLSSLSQ